MTSRSFQQFHNLLRRKVVCCYLDDFERDINKLFKRIGKNGSSPLTMIVTLDTFTKRNNNFNNWVIH